MATCCTKTPQDQGWDWIPTTPPEPTTCAGAFGDDDQPWHGDWQIGSGGELQAGNQLHSAVLMQLFTDKHIPNDQADSIADPLERGGWWGDYFAPFPIGSLLWTLYRAALTEETIQAAERYTREALQPLIDQGAAAEQQVNVYADKRRSLLMIDIGLFSRSGSKTYSQQFQRFW